MIVRLRNKRPSHCNGAGDRWSVVLSCSSHEERRHTEEPTTKPVPPTSLKEENSKKKVLVELIGGGGIKREMPAFKISESLAGNNSIFNMGGPAQRFPDFSPHLERVSLRRFSRAKARS